MTAVIVLLVIILYAITGFSLALFELISTALETGEIESPGEFLLTAAFSPILFLTSLIMLPFDDEARRLLGQSSTAQVTRVITVNPEQAMEALDQERQGRYARPRRNIP